MRSASSAVTPPGSRSERSIVASARPEPRTGPKGRARARGLGLVEVLVAMAVLAINLLGWTALLQLVLALLRRIGELGVAPDPAAAAAACGLALAAPRTTVWHRVAAAWRVGLARRRALPLRPWRPAHPLRPSRPSHPAYPARPSNPSLPSRRGLGLAELLVALAIAALLFGALAGAVATSGRAARSASAEADARTLRPALEALLGDVLRGAGRGLGDACGLLAAEGGQRLGVRHALRDGTIVTDEVFAALDGAGRPALYLRRVPHARQPWVEDVTAFAIERVEREAAVSGVSGRVLAVRLTLTHAALDAPLALEVALPHRPCVEAPP